MTIRGRAALRLALAVLVFAPAARGQDAGSGEAVPEAPTPQADSRPAEPSLRPDTAINTWYAQAMAHGDAGLNVTYFWSKDAKMRAETVIAGHKIVTIVNGDTYYAYDGTARNGVAIQRTPDAIAADSPTRRPFGRELESLLKQGAELVGEQEFHGARVMIYRITDPRGRREVWVSKSGAQLPVKAVIYYRHSRKTQKTEYLNWLRNIPIHESFFDPDPSIELERYDFRQYMEESAKSIGVGPVPVLYGDLLHGNIRRTEN